MKTKYAQSASLRGLEVPGAVLRPFAGEHLMLLRAEGKAGSPLAAHAHTHGNALAFHRNRSRPYKDCCWRVGNHSSESGQCGGGVVG